MRLLFTVCTVLAMLTVLVIAPRHAEAKGSFATVSGGDLPRTIHVPYSDTQWVPNSDDPWQAYDRPRPVDRPEMLGDAYALRTEYVYAELWRQGIEPDDWETEYYPEQAVIALEADGAEHWYVIDAEVNALLERYLAVGRAGLLPEWPSRLHLAVGESILTGAPVAVTAAITPYGPWRGARIALDAAEFWRHLVRLNGTYREIHSTEFEDRRTHLSPWRGDVWPLDPNRDQAIFLTYPDGTEHVLTYLVEHDLLVYSASPGMPWWYGWELDEEFVRFVGAYLPAADESAAEKQTLATALASPGATASSGTAAQLGSTAPSTSTSHGRALLLLLALGASVVGVAGIARAVAREGR